MLYIFCIRFTCKLKLFLSQALGSSYIVVGSPQLETKDYAKYLGVMFDSNLAGKYHTQSICHKMRKEKKQLKTTTIKNGYYSSQLIPHCVPRHVLLSVYKSCIRDD